LPAVRAQFVVDLFQGRLSEKYYEPERRRHATASPNEREKLASRCDAIPRDSRTASNEQLQIRSLDRRIQVVLNWMNDNFTRELSLDTIAATVNLSPSHLRHLFKQEMRSSPTHILKLMRLERAKELMQGSFLSVKEVMILVGMTDLSHFVKDYKNMHGETPGQTRRKYHQD